MSEEFGDGENRGEARQDGGKNLDSRRGERLGEPTSITDRARSGRSLPSTPSVLQMLASRSGADGVDPHPTLHHCMGNLMNSIVFGVTFEEEDETWRWLQRLQEDGVKHIGVAGPLNFLPFLRLYFPDPSQAVIADKATN